MANTTIDPKRSAMDWMTHVEAFAQTSKLTVEGDWGLAMKLKSLDEMMGDRK